MAISYMTITAENNPYICCIELHFTTSLNNPSGFDKIVIKRKEGGTIGAWRTVFEKSVSTRSDLIFTAIDLSSVSGKSYTYSVDLMYGSNVAPVASETLALVECWYSGMFVGNRSKQFVATANYEVNSKLQTQVQYVNTLSGRTPYRVSNSDNCYYTGSASGLFLAADLGSMQLLPDNNHSRQTAVADFLTDGTDKILKTDDGRIWYISVDDTVSLPFNDRYLGMNSIGFNWTEIGDLPLVLVVEV